MTHPYKKPSNDLQGPMADMKGDVKEIPTRELIQRTKDLLPKFKASRAAFEKELWFRADKWADEAALEYVRNFNIPRPVLKTFPVKETANV